MASNSGNIGTKIKFKFLIIPELIQVIFYYISNLAETTLLGRLFHTAKM